MKYCGHQLFLNCEVSAHANSSGFMYTYPLFSHLRSCEKCSRNGIGLSVGSDGEKRGLENGFVTTSDFGG